MYQFSLLPQLKIACTTEQLISKSITHLGDRDSKVSIALVNTINKYKENHDVS